MQEELDGEIISGSMQPFEGQTEIIDDGGPIPEGAVFHEGDPGMMLQGSHGGESCCGDGSCGGDCGDGCCGPCAPASCCLIPCLGLPHNILLSGGVHGFKGPINRGSDSSFGFNESINWGFPCDLFGCGMGAQVGVRGAHSNFSGATGLTVDDRNQLFVTGGLFRRVDCGFQCGAVIDYLHEDWDVSLDLAQIRAELSYVFVGQGEFGFRWAFPTTTDDSLEPPAVVGVEWEPVETYTFFYRQKFLQTGAECQLLAGFTAESEGLIGAEALLPLADRLAMVVDYTYLIPEDGAAAIPNTGSLQESWNVGLGLVLYPDAGFLNPANYYRPLFNVAHNGSFLYDVQD
jgi:hypothetical protein